VMSARLAQSGELAPGRSPLRLVLAVAVEHLHAMVLAVVLLR